MMLSKFLFIGAFPLRVATASIRDLARHPHRARNHNRILECKPEVKNKRNNYLPFLLILSALFETIFIQ
jgi:hypothetical protein